MRHGCAQLGADVSKHGGPAFEGWVPNNYEALVEPSKGSVTADKMGHHNGTGTLHDKVRLACNMAAAGHYCAQSQV